MLHFLIDRLGKEKSNDLFGQQCNDTTISGCAGFIYEGFNWLLGNPSSLHGFGGKAEQLLAKAREQAASLLKVNPAEIIFTSGGSESNNLAIKGAALQYKARGKHIITSSIEHPSVLNPAEQLSDLGYEITYLPVDEYGRVNVTQLKEAIQKTRFSFRLCILIMRLAPSSRLRK